MDIDAEVGDQKYITDSDFLNGIYEFPHLAAYSNQSNDMLHKYLKCIIAFSESLWENDMFPVDLLNALDLKKFKLFATNIVYDRKNLQLFEQTEDAVFVLAFAPYGCVILIEHKDVDVYIIRSIALDKWEFATRVKLTLSENAPHNSVPTSYSFGVRGYTSDLPKFLKDFDTLYDKATTKTGDKRSALNKGGGHQKTPSFICSLIDCVIEESEEYMPRGGTTDVGLHTGGIGRNTCWHLVKAVMKDALGIAAQKVMFYFHLDVLQKYLNTVHPSTLSQSEINNTLVIYNCAVVEARQFLALRNIDFNHLEKPLKIFRQKIEDMLHSFSECKVAEVVLANLTDQLIYPDLPSVTPLRAFNTVSDPLEVRNRSLGNIGYIPILGDTKEFRELSNWLTTIELFKNDNKDTLIITTIQTFFYKNANYLSDPLWPFGTDIISTLNNIIEIYEKSFNEWISSSTTKDVMIVKHHSERLIVYWLSCCLIHRQCLIDCYLLRDYALPINSNDMRICVLDTEISRNALKILTDYIDSYSLKESTIFSLEIQQGTFQFGLDFAKSSSAITASYRAEKLRIKNQKEDYMKVVSVKKSKAAQLRAEHATISFQKNKAINERDIQYNKFQDAIRGRHGKRYLDGIDKELQSLKSNLDHLSQLEAAKAHQIAQVIVSPNFIISPLPSVEKEALKILGLLFLTSELNIFSKFCLMAQSKLTDLNWKGQKSEEYHNYIKTLKLPSIGRTWAHHYQTYSNRSSPNLNYLICPKNMVVPISFGPKTIDNISDVSQISWYPDQFESFLHVSEGFNWFHSDMKWTQIFFSETISDDKLQWVIDFPDTGTYSSSRGNYVFSQLEFKPNKLTKLQFYAVGSLRSFPNQQIRKLIDILTADNVPFDINLVKVSIKQALYQVGPLSEREGFEWKRDLVKGLPLLASSLEDILAILKQNRSKYKNLSVLSDICAYIADFDSFYRYLPRMCSQIAQDWATETRTQMDSEDCPSRLLYLRAMECLMIGYAIIPYSFYDLEMVDMITIISQITKYQNSCLYACDSDLMEEIDSLQTAIGVIMAKHCSQLCECISENPTALTGCIQLIHQQLNSDVSWAMISVNGHANLNTFEANDDDHFYMFNVYSGVFLVDGLPPCSLPDDILSNPLYLKTFKDRDFEVIKKNDTLTTTMAVDDSIYYDFTIVDEYLLIVENERKTNSRWELIDFGNRLQWFSDLPVGLNLPFSHWFNESKGIMIFRDHYFRNRDIYYYIDFNELPHPMCFQVAKSMINLELDEIFNTKTNLLAFHLRSSDCTIIEVLQKFESLKYIHILKSKGEHKIKFSLVRFGLSFCLSVNPDTEELEVSSIEYQDYKLANNQRLSNFLPFFDHYLLLERKSGCDKLAPMYKLIVPNGKIIKSENRIFIQLDDDMNSKYNFMTYNLNQRSDTFLASTIESRLQLAVIYAASSIFMADKRLRMTGTEAAMELVYRCQLNRPLTNSEILKVNNLIEFSSLEPALTVLCVKLYDDSFRMKFLFDSKMTDHIPLGLSKISQGDAASACCENNQKHWWNHFRRSFKPFQLQEYLGTQSNTAFENANSKCFDSVADLQPSNIPTGFVEKIEKELSSFVAESNRKFASFPINSFEVNQTKLNRKITEVQKESWKTHQKSKVQHLSQVESLKNYLDEIEISVKENRIDLETSIIDYCNLRPTSVQNEFILKTLSGITPTFTLDDIMKMAVDISIITIINPHLSEYQISALHTRIIRYLKMCCLEDKIERLLNFLHQDDHSQVVQCLMTKREWKCEDHPYWLVFEVENTIQIRANQYKIAQSLIDHPNSIMQLNMGQGKTRVILPMLIMYYSSINKIPRIHILTPLLKEAFDYLHGVLTASVISIRIHEQPFCRDVELDSISKISKIGSNTKVKECLIIAPEHRLSLELKALGDSENDLGSSIGEMIGSLKYVDIFDESDALLSHTYQLIYAIGNPGSLQDIDERIVVAQALFNILNYSETIQEFLEREGMLLKNEVSSHGAYSQYRLPYSENENVKMGFRAAIANELVSNPCYELWCIKKADKCFGRDALIKLMADLTYDPQVDQWDDKIAPVTRKMILAIRGLLAYGLFEFSLEQRYRVTYGIDERRKKRLAIPFRAADEPTDRSEFSHPDTNLLLTFSAYYHKGLTKPQFHEALKLLLSLGVPAQKREYEKWYCIIKDQLNQDAKDKIDKISKFDMTNRVQQDLLYKTYYNSMEAINFWLRLCVLPFDTAQYPQNISGNAWHIAKGCHSVGFSGTKDTHYLLPGQVCQKEPDIAELKGTDGKMLECLINETISYEVLGSKTEGLVYQSLLDYCLKKNVNAIIDSGSLLAGISNESAAKYIAKSKHFSFDGVFYFESSKNLWMVLDPKTMIKSPRSESHILERNSFVIFDDARTRGSDMKLKRSAIAVQTLGPNILKEKLMQGAGRLRKLGQGQKLIIVSSKEIEKNIKTQLNIKGSHKINIRDILQWVILNSENVIRLGLLLWTSQGLNFIEGENDQTKRFCDENWSLERLYGSFHLPNTVSEVMKLKYSEQLVVSGESSQDNTVELKEKILDQLDSFGNDYEMHVSECNDQCEREMQLEEVEEEEKEVMIPMQHAEEEVRLGFNAIINCDSIAKLSKSIPCLHISKAVKNSLSMKELNNVKWSFTKIYITANFLKTVQRCNNSNIDNFIRHVDMFLMFACGEILLVSDYEADELLQIFWESPTKDLKHLRFVNLTAVVAKRNIMEGDKLPKEPIFLGGWSTAVLRDIDLTAIQLFNGETTFPTSSKSLSILLDTDAAKVGIKYMIFNRGLGHNWNCSDLERICGEY